MMISNFLFIGRGWLVLVLLAVECFPARAATNELVWPPPPEAPRIAFVKTLSGPVDVGIRRSFLGRMAGVITGAKPELVLSKPQGVAVDENGSLLVTDVGTPAVWVFDLKRREYARWEKIGPYQLVSPVSVARVQDLGFVADSGLAAVLAFDRKGQLRFALTNGLERPTGLALTAQKLFVADATAHRIVIFDLQGRRLGEFGRRGQEPGAFNYPTHIAADLQGHLLVTDSMNGRVQILDREGKPLGVVGSYGDSPGHFSRPKGVAADRQGHVYVADALFDNVQVFDPRGQLLLRVGENGQQAGEFWMPGGIAISRDDQIYVADTYNHRVQVFRYIGPP